MNDKRMSKLFWAAKAMLVAVLLYVAVEAVIPPFQLDTEIKPKAVAGGECPHNGTISESQPSPPTDYSVILDNDLFGKSEPATVDPPVKSTTEEALPSAEKLGLRLCGIVAGGPITSRAIIEDTSTKLTLPYKIGDRVGSATIESIEPDRVIVLHGGQKAVLQIYVGTTPSKSIATERLEAAPLKATSNQHSPQPTIRLGYIEDLFREATIEPYVKDGETEGLKISGLEETPLTKLFGLRNGDVVQAVNGQDLSSKQKAFQVLKKARTQSSINLQLLRDGQTKELSFDL